jgi:hypothetical protein
MEQNRIAIEFDNSDGPAETAAARLQWEQFDRNSAWLHENLAAVGDNYRGKVICIAGQELFAGDTTREAVAQATAAHPEDKGRFTLYIPMTKAARIYALPR